MSDYHSDYTHLSNSMLTVLKRSPKEFHQRYIAKTWIDKETEAMKFGSLLHTMCLEPHKIEHRYAIAPKVDKRTTAGKAAWSEFVEANKGKTFVSPDDLQQASRCAETLMHHDQVGQLLLYSDVHEARIEQALTFSIEGTPCKAKPDWLSVPLKLIVDVKTTKYVSPDLFAKSVAAYGYHRQAAMYIHAVYEVFGINARFIFACVTKEPPYEVACYELSTPALQMGMSELLSLVDDYEQRKARNNWNASYSTGIVPLSLPRWYKGQILTLEESEEDDTSTDY
jgi:exodeoxyribonuclease VIII